MLRTISISKATQKFAFLMLILVLTLMAVTPVFASQPKPKVLSH